MKRFVLLLSLALAAATPAFAQNYEGPPTLTANGAGMTYGEPDLVTVTIGVTSRAEKPAEALAANNADIQRVIDAVVAAGVDTADVATIGFSINPVYADQRPDEQGNFGLPAVIGYEVSNQLSVKIRDIASSGAVLDQVVEAGANQINNIQFDIAEPQALQDEALANAIADARRTGEMMAAAAGVTLGRLLSVQAYSDAQPVFSERSYSMAANVPIVGGERSLSASATLVWEITE